MNQVQDFENCVEEERRYLAQPADPDSLYAEGIYDTQAADATCYMKKPINIIEGFKDSSKSTLMTIIKWLIIILIIYIIIVLLLNIFHPTETVKIGITAPTDASPSSLKF